MSNDRLPASEVEELIAFADKIARRTSRHFVVNKKKCEDFAEFSAAIEADCNRKNKVDLVVTIKSNHLI